MPRTLLLEIGVEELPARLCPMALEQLRTHGEEALREQRLAFAFSRTLGTPRRLAWIVDGLADRQADAQTAVRGPAKASAFRPDGSPTPAAEGFARSQGVSVEDLAVEAVGGKEYVFVRRLQAGRAAQEVVADLLPRLVAALDFPRTMRWGTGDFRFPRPIRWLVALLGAEVVRFDIEGLVSDRVTYGHRTLHPGPVELARPEEYVERLRAAWVLVDGDERRQAIWRGLETAVQAVDGRPRENAELLDEVVHINEWPTAFVGRFDPAALDVPEPVLVTVMRVHQRYFPVEDADGGLLPFFAGVRNGGDHNLTAVAAGNEKVLAARFADARFFYEEDRKEPLAARVDRLGTVTFAEGLGSLADKSRRVRHLALWLADRVGAEAAVVARAAELCKADRLTHVVYELPELEGTMGAYYAIADGEPAPVAEAIGGHVLPRFSGDALPGSQAGAVLAVADRLDTLTGQFMLGRQPQGGADPLGLRRAAGALVRILEDAGWDVSVREAVAAASAAYGDLPGDASGVPAFIGGRLRVRLEEAGYRKDVVDAVLAAGDDRVAEAFARCRALSEAVASDGWADTVTAFKRAGNLARQGTGAPAVRSDALGHKSERALWDAVREARAAADRALAAGDHKGVLAATASLRRPVDAFLTDVLVMDPDPEVRSNRLALLAAVASIPEPVADLGRLQGGER